MKIRTELNANYTYLSTDPKKENRHLIKCNKCGMVLSKTEDQMVSFKHGKYCSSVAHAFIRKNHGENIDKIFTSKFSSIKNKIVIDNGLNYEDFLDYFNCEFKKFLIAVEDFGIENITFIQENTEVPFGKGNLLFVSKK